MKNTKTNWLIFKNKLIFYKKKIPKFIKNQLFKYIYLFLSKTIEVVISSIILLLVFSFFGWELSILNLLCCIALYFIIEELKYFLLKLSRGRKK